MTIETKYDKGQQVFIIYNDKIIHPKIDGIEYSNGEITYHFTIKKAFSPSLGDNNETVTRTQAKVWSSVDELAAFFKNEADKF